MKKQNNAYEWYLQFINQYPVATVKTIKLMYQLCPYSIFTIKMYNRLISLRLKELSYFFTQYKNLSVAFPIYSIGTDFHAEDVITDMYSVFGIRNIIFENPDDAILFKMSIDNTIINHSVMVN